MAYMLENDVWFCQVGEHLIFLDVRDDCYFRLPLPLERAFVSYMQDDTASDMRALLERRLVNRLSMKKSPKYVSGIHSPKHSALEQPPADSEMQRAPLLEVATTVSLVLLRLKTLPLKNVLANMWRYRRKHALQIASNSDGAVTAQFVDAANRFNSTRLYVPVEPSCLLDSIALSIFLAKQHIHSTVVFGVTCNPFSAHSWVQIGDLVLNDTVGNACAYTPIAVF